MKFSLIVSLLLAVSSATAAGQEMKPPRLSAAAVDWAGALDTLAGNEALRPAALAARSRRTRSSLSVPPVLARLNAVTTPRFPDIARSPVPVLLPFDVGALLRDQAAGAAAESNQRYLAGFHTRSFFFPGPAGYAAAFAIRVSEIDEFSDARFAEPISVHISGSALLYELDEPAAKAGTPVPALEAEFPGIRRLIHEHHLRYTFVRFGVPYAVSIGCFNAGVSRYRMPTCRLADRVALRFLRALQIAGGTPEPQRPVEPLALERPADISPTFSYHAPGRLLPGTGFRSLNGRTDTTAYSQIRFPVAVAPAFVNSQMFQSRNKPLAPGHSPNYAYPWRDNFCERRGFPVGQCPAGNGHQGQDIRTPPCTPEPGASRCTLDRDVVAVRDGAILRAPGQEAAYLYVNTAREHLRFRYLHMHPRKMDDDGLLSGRLVNEGEVIGRIGNFSKKEGGTSYHLHFDVQVPTKDGWVFVNPYMTLVSSYERLIGARGEQVLEPTLLANSDTTASLGRSAHLEPEASNGQKRRAAKYGKRKKHKRRFARH